LPSHYKELQAETRPSIGTLTISKTTELSSKQEDREFIDKLPVKDFSLVRTRHYKTSTWPSLQHTIWQGITALPFHELREDHRLRTATASPTKRPLKLMWGSSISTVDRVGSSAGERLPSRLGNSAMSSSHRRGDDCDSGLRLKTIGRNPSSVSSYRVRPLVGKKNVVLSDTTPPMTPPNMDRVYYVRKYVVK